MTDFPALIRTLADGGIDFIVVGGAAATAHGSARLTQDLDVVYRRAPETFSRLATALAPYHPYLRGAPAGLPFRWEPETIARGLNLTLTTDLGALDLLGEITGGGGYDALLPHSVPLRLFGVACRCLDLEHLIHVKRGRRAPSRSGRSRRARGAPGRTQSAGIGRVAAAAAESAHSGRPFFLYETVRTTVS